ncbi:grlE [Symbiodinium sp. CCMP2456]|nr:grlE [Symbiodinium sp. CCMP2456]
MATTAAVQQIPQISFSATSPLLSNKDAYPYFLRTVPPDTVQAIVLWNWILEFDVPLAICLYTEEAYGQSLFKALGAQAQSASGRLRLVGQAVRYMPPDAFQEEEARRSLEQTKSLGSHFLVLLIEFSMVPRLMPVMAQEGLLASDWQAIGSDTLAWPTAHAFLPLGFMMVVARGQGSKFSEFRDLWSTLGYSDLLGSDAQARYGIGRMRTPLAEVSNATLSAAVQSYHAFAFDAAYSFIIAINQMLLRGVAEHAVRGQALLEELRGMNFSGVSGDVRFDSNGDRLASYELLNMQGDALAPVASSVAIFSTSALEFSFRSRSGLVWMNGLPGANPPEDLLACDAGFFKEELSRQCRPCPRGTMCPGGVDAQFRACPKGTFTNETGMTSCLLCLEGFAAREVGSVQCTECQPGYEAPMQGMEACTRCELGSYMPSVQGTRCVPCGLNQTTLFRGAEAASECVCPEGLFMCEARGCIPCPEGLYCPTGLGTPHQVGGFWTESSGPGQCDFSVLRCRDQAECPPGPLGVCASGREGLACNNCNENHFPGDDGTCQACADADVLPTILVLLLALSLLLVLVCTHVDPNQQSLNVLTAAAIFSQIIISIQALGSIRKLAIAWQEPAKTIVELTRLLTFDFDIIRISCFLGTDSPSLKFLSKILVCPFGCAVLLATWLGMKLCGRHRPPDSVVNMCGLLFFAFFLSIALTSLIPFRCARNPDGSTSMVSDPGIICYESEEHAVLVALAVAGILSQPAVILAWTSHATFMYPSRVASGSGLRQVHRHRFLFHRFKPESFYFGLVLLYRNGIVAVLPVLSVGIVELQVPVMGTILLASLALQVRTYPWRTVQANVVDMLLTVLLLVILLGAAPLLSIDFQNSSQVLGWLLCVPIFGLLLVGLAGLSRVALRHFYPAAQYGVFLCHHKGGAGSLCRLLKLIIARHTSTRVFLDCDQLENLDFLFDIIRTSTNSVAAVLTPELLRRVWCGGEITTAWKNKITTVPLVCDGFLPLSDEAQKLIPTLWTPQQKQILANYGVEIEDVHAAYAWLQNDLTSIQMPRFGPVSRREEAVLEMLARCGLYALQMPSARLRRITSTPVLHNTDAARARILITSSVADAECLSACEVFQIMLQAYLQVECAVVHGSRQMIHWKPYAYYLVVLLFRGIFRDAGFQRILTAAFAAPGRRLELVTVLADSHFDFPSLEDSVDGSGDLKTVRRTLTEETSSPSQQLAEAQRELLTVLALPFSPLASEGLQHKQVAEVAHRMHRYEEPAKAASLDEADDARLAEVDMGAKNSDTLAWDAGNAGEGELGGDLGDPEGVTEVHADLSLRSDSLSI